MNTLTDWCLGPALVTALPPTVLNGFCSYLVQPLNLVETRTLLIMGSLCLFLGLCGSLIFWEYRLTGVVDSGLLPLYTIAQIFHRSCSYLVQLFGLGCGMKSLCLFHRVSNLLLGLGRPRVPVPWTVFYPVPSTYYHGNWNRLTWFQLYISCDPFFTLLAWSIYIPATVCSALFSFTFRVRSACTASNLLSLYSASYHAGPFL